MYFQYEGVYLYFQYEGMYVCLQLYPSAVMQTCNAFHFCYCCNIFVAICKRYFGRKILSQQYTYSPIVKAHKQLCSSFLMFNSEEEERQLFKMYKLWQGVQQEVTLGTRGGRSQSSSCFTEPELNVCNVCKI